MSKTDSHPESSSVPAATGSTRRDFLKTTGVGAILALPVLSPLLGQIFGSSTAQAQTAPVAVKESDPTAQALGYKEDATKVDVKKFPKRADAEGKKQFCSGCQFYQAKDKADKAAPCTIFAGKLVKSTGWCNTWAKKA